MGALHETHGPGLGRGRVQRDPGGADLVALDMEVGQVLVPRGAFGGIRLLDQHTVLPQVDLVRTQQFRHDPGDRGVQGKGTAVRIVTPVIGSRDKAPRAPSPAGQHVAPGAGDFLAHGGHVVHAGTDRLPHQSVNRRCHAEHESGIQHAAQADNPVLPEGRHFRVRGQPHHRFIRHACQLPVSHLQDKGGW